MNYKIDTSGMSDDAREIIEAPATESYPSVLTGASTECLEEALAVLQGIGVKQGKAGAIRRELGARRKGPSKFTAHKTLEWQKRFAEEWRGVQRKAEQLKRQRERRERMERERW